MDKKDTGIYMRATAFGWRERQMRFIESTSRANEAVIRYLIGGIDMCDHDEICEKLADLQIALNQVVVMCGVTKFNSKFERKLAELEEKIRMDGMSDREQDEYFGR